MKSLKLFFPLIALALFFSCSEDETPSFDEEKFVGTWNMVALTYDGTSSSEFAGVKVTSTFDGEGVDMDLEVEFTRNPNEMHTTGDYGILLDVTTQGVETSQEWTNQEFISSGTWTLNGDQMVVSTGGADHPVRVVSLTETTMRLEEKITEETKHSGAKVTYDVTALYTFEKQ